MNRKEIYSNSIVLKISQAHSMGRIYVSFCAKSASKSKYNFKQLRLLILLFNPLNSFFLFRYVHMTRFKNGAGQLALCMKLHHLNQYTSPLISPTTPPPPPPPPPDREPGLSKNLLRSAYHIALCVLEGTCMYMCVCVCVCVCCACMKLCVCVCVSRCIHIS